MPHIEHNRSFSGIQGRVSRAERLGDLTLTDTLYSPRLRLYPHAHECACFGFVLAGGFSEQFPVRRLSYTGRAVFFRPPELVHENCLYEQWQEMDDVAPLAIEGLACEMAAQFCRTVRARREANPPRWLRHVHEMLRCLFKESLPLAAL